MLKLLRMSASLKTLQRHLASFATTSFNGTQHEAGGDGDGVRYAKHGISSPMHGSEVPSSPPGGDRLGFPEKAIETHEVSKIGRRMRDLEAIADA